LGSTPAQRRADGLGFELRLALGGRSAFLGQVPGSRAHREAGLIDRDFNAPVLAVLPGSLD
jgi:hypothetical protein